MGILNWRVWDRLDELDRRTGFRRDRTERWAKGMPLVFAAVAVGFAVNTLIYLVQARWTMAIVEGLIALVNGLASLSLLRSGPRRLSGGRGLLSPRSSPTTESDE